MRQLGQRIVRGFYGGHQPRDAALAVVLGLVGGYLTGWNLSVSVVLVAAVFLNVHTRLLAATWAAAAALAALTSGATNFVGVAILDWAGLGRAVAALGDGPLAALLGWDQYELVGGACLAAVVSLPAARFAARAVRSLGAVERPKGAGGSDLAPEAAAAPGLLARGAIWFLFGWSARERAMRCESVGGWLRPLGLPAALAVITVAALAPWYVGPKLAARELLRQISKYNDAEVAAGEVHLSLWTGRFSVRDLQVADPRHLHRDRLRVGALSGQLSAGALLRGRLEIERLMLDRVRVDVARHRLARSSASRPHASGLPSPTDASLSATSSIEIDRYVRAWPSIRHDLVWLERLVVAVESLSTVGSHHDLAGDGSHRPLRSDFGQPRPRVAIARLRARDLPAGLQLGRKAIVELTDLSSRPDLAEEPTRLKVVIPRLAALLLAQFELAEDNHRHTLKFTADDLDLAELLDARQDEQSIAATGRVNLAGKGWMNSRQLELPLQIEFDTLEIELAGHERLARIDAAIWSQGLRRLGAVETEAVLSGPWASATLTVDPRHVVEQFKHQLRAAGQHQLVQAIDEQLASSIDEQLADSPIPETATSVMQAAALESEPPGTAGVSELSDDDPSGEPIAGDRMASESLGNQTADGNGTGAGPARDAIAAQPDDATSAVATDDAYPTTSVPYDDSVAPYDAPPPAPPAPVADYSRGSRRTAQLPGPMGLAVGHDPIGSSASPPDAAYHPVQYAAPRRGTLPQPVPPLPPEPPMAESPMPDGGESAYSAPASYSAAADSPALSPPVPYPGSPRPAAGYGPAPYDDVSAIGPGEPELDGRGESPRVVRPSLLTKWSKGLRQRFARKPRMADDEESPSVVDPPEYNGPVFDAPAYEPAMDDAPSKPVAADHPWYKRLWR
jgi:hypothetical protein